MPERAGVSVVIPTYNRSALVSEAVASALAQEWDPLEVIVVDDASTDDTVERLRSFAANDSRLRIIALGSTQGPSVARNQGILAARHEYVAFLDSDNTYMREKLARQMPALLSIDAPAVSFSAYSVTGDAGDLPVLLERWDGAAPAVVSALLNACVVNTSTFVAPRAVLTAHGMFRTDLMCAEDHDLWLRLAVLGHRFLYEATPLTRYRRHDGSLSGDLARVARCEEVVINDFLARPDIPEEVALRSGLWRAQWALSGAERFLASNMPGEAMRALVRAARAHPRSIRVGWVRLALKAFGSYLRLMGPAGGMPDA